MKFEIETQRKEAYEPIPIFDSEGNEGSQWLEVRKKGLGGSDVAVLFGANKYKNEAMLYQEKVGITPPFKKETSSSTKEIFFAGHVIEDTVAKYFEYKMKNDGYDIRVLNDTHTYQHGKLLEDAEGDLVLSDDGEPQLAYPFAHANVDRVIIMDGKYKGILECKHIGVNFYDKIKSVKDGKCPPEYDLQCRWYMAILNVQFCYIALLYGNRPSDMQIIRIDRDYDIEESLLKKAADFWNNYVQQKKEPPVSGPSTVFLKYYEELYGAPEPTKEVKILPFDAADAVEELKRNQETIDTLKSKIALLESRRADLFEPLVDYFKDCEKAKLDMDAETTVFVEYKQPLTKVSYDVERMKKDDPELYEAGATYSFSQTKLKSALKKRVANFKILPQPNYSKPREIKVSVSKHEARTI